MRFSYAESMIDPLIYPTLAVAAEGAGFTSMVIPDSICYPEVSLSTYPFNPDGSREFLEDKPFIEPFSLICALGAVTTSLRFVLFVLKLPVRNPVLVAKQATSAAVLTDNRLVLGVGSSPWKEDYEVLGIPWEGRGKRMDESVAIIKGLGQGGYFSFHGTCFDVPSIKINPVPTVAIPMMFGGEGEKALRRAVVEGDGWLHGGGEPARLDQMLSRIEEMRKEEGTQNRPFEIHVISPDAYSPDGIQRLSDKGVTDVIVGFRWPYGTEQDVETVKEKIDHLERFAETVIAKVRV